MSDIAKIIEIRNIARIRSYAAKGDVSFRRINLIYGQNGHGKTSLCAVLRSLSTGDATPITERTTLGQNDSSAVRLLVDGKQVTFDGTSWSATDPDILIYDSTFVGENVYTGDAIEHKHRKNLYEVVVGSANVVTAKTIEGIDVQTRALSDELGRLDAQIREHMLAPFDLTEFLRLEALPEEAARDEIVRMENSLAAARQATTIVARPQLQAVPIPRLPSGIEEALRTTFASLHEDASRVLGEHLRRLGSGAEEWLFKGLGHKRGDSCPFCAQDIGGNQLVKAYGDYFSQAYRAHQTGLHQSLNEVDRLLGKEVSHALELQFATNNSRIEKWSDLIDLSAANAAVGGVGTRLERLLSLLRDAITAKQRMPTTPITVSPELAAAQDDVTQLAAEISTYNERIAVANGQIAATKTASASADIAQLEVVLRRLKNRVVRHKPDAAALCERYRASQQKKAALGGEKEALKKALATQTEDVLRNYEKEINALLERFGATFRIVGSKPVYAGGKAASSYKIRINACDIDLSAPAGKPSFRGLSGGDRTTLAFAFFVAQVLSDPSLATKTVVIDDPISSLDSFRSSCTQHLVADVGAKAGKLLVLSHDLLFLKGVYDRSVKADIKALQFRRVADATELVEWDPIQAAKSKHQNDQMMLQRFVDGDQEADPQSVIKCIRPFLEGALRMRFPGFFPEDRWLGDFIEIVRNAEATSPASGMKADLGDLVMVNDYSKRSHHADGSGAASTIDDAELRAHVAQALRLAAGGPAS